MRHEEFARPGVRVYQTGGAEEYVDIQTSSDDVYESRESTEQTRECAVRPELWLATITQQTMHVPCLS